MGCTGNDALGFRVLDLGLGFRGLELLGLHPATFPGFFPQRYLPIGPLVPFYALYLESCKVIPKRNYLGAYGVDLGGKVNAKVQGSTVVSFAPNS